MNITSDQDSVSPLPEIVISDDDVPLETLMGVAFERRRVRLSSAPAWTAKLQKSRAVLERSLSAGHRIYGVSTGVGYNSKHAVDPTHIQEFAYQIIRQHGCGLGEMFPIQQARAIVFARLVSLAKGYSAVLPELLQALCGLLNQGVIPVIPMLGSVGASGDLTPLSYLAAVLLGEREAYYEGDILPAGEALRRAGLAVHHFVPKESLAIMNGTAVMTAIRHQRRAHGTHPGDLRGRHGSRRRSDVRPFPGLCPHRPPAQTPPRTNRGGRRHSIRLGRQPHDR